MLLGALWEAMMWILLQGASFLHLCHFPAHWSSAMAKSWVGVVFSNMKILLCVSLPKPLLKFWHIRVHLSSKESIFILGIDIRVTVASRISFMFWVSSEISTDSGSTSLEPQEESTIAWSVSVALRPVWRSVDKVLRRMWTGYSLLLSEWHILQNSRPSV